MMRSLYSGVSGLRTHQTRMDVIGNNIANVNTTAYKAKNITFSDMLYQTTQSATGPNTANGTAGTNPRQIGLGVKTGAINTSITTEGATQSTGNPFDLKLTGEAFFVVSDGKNQYFTRDGSFNVDAAGYLCMGSTGYIVQGWTNTDAETGAIIQDSVKPIQVMSEKNATYPAAYTTKATISGIIDKYDDNLQTENGRILNVQTLDNLGYEYNLKFGITPVKGTAQRTITNTENLYDFLDKKPTLYRVDVSNRDMTIKYADGITKAFDSASRPELQQIIEDAIKEKHVAGTPNDIVTLKITKVDSDNAQIDFGGAAPVTVSLNEYSDLVGSEISIKLDGQMGYATDMNDIEGTRVNIDDAVVKLIANTPTGAGTVTFTSSVMVTQQKYTNDEGNDVSEYKITTIDNSGNKTVQTDVKISDIQALLNLTTPEKVSEYQTSETKDGSDQPGQFKITLLGITDSDGKEVVSKDDVPTKFATYQYNIKYNTDNGKLEYVGEAGKTTFDLNLATALGNNFSNITFDMSNTSNVDNGGKSNIEGLRDDGRKVGTLTGVAIGTDGVITANYSNGMSKSIAQIAVATFANAMGLQNEGDNLYSATANSGEFNGVGVDIKASGTGYMTTGVLEMSNVDLSQQFTDMITTQRGFQANSRIITTSDTLLEELVNLKR